MASSTDARKGLLARVKAHRASSAPSVAGDGPFRKKLRADDANTELGEGEDLNSVYDESAAAAGVPAGKVCAGCLRVTGTDRSFVDPSRGFAWLYTDGRGEYCRDCATVHRLLYRTVMNLSSFGRWVADHRSEFLPNVVALASLRKEGHRHLSGEAITARKEMIQHACNLMSMPMGCPVVTPVGSGTVKQLKDAFVLPGSKPGELFMLSLPAPSPMLSPCRVVTKHAGSMAWPVTLCSGVTEGTRSILQDSELMHDDVVMPDASSGDAAASSGDVPETAVKGDPVVQKFEKKIKDLQELRMLGDPAICPFPGICIEKSAFRFVCSPLLIRRVYGHKTPVRELVFVCVCGWVGCLSSMRVQ